MQGYVKVTPTKVRASDQVIFWATLFMSHKIGLLHTQPTSIRMARFAILGSVWTPHDH